MTKQKCDSQTGQNWFNLHEKLVNGEQKNGYSNLANGCKLVELGGLLEKRQHINPYQTI